MKPTLVRNRPPEPPARLGKSGKKLWRSAIDITNPLDRALLEIACAYADNIALMEAAIKKDGLVLTNRFGSQRAHPLAPGLRAAQRALRMTLKDLNFAKKETNYGF